VITDLTLRWVVTVLFILSAVECAYAVVVGRRTAMFAIGQVLHLTMAVAMAVMAWPRGAELPTVAPMIFFLLAWMWFVAAAVIDPRHWAGNLYHAAMMFSMAWMYGVMNGQILPGHARSGGSSGHHHGADMPGMDMPDMPMDTAGESGPLPYIAAINWLWAVGFAIAAVWWLYRYCAVARRRAAPRYARLGPLGQAMMAAGMAVMFGVML